MKEQNKDRRIYIMSEEKPAKAVLKMGIPVTFGMLFMVFYNLVDTYFVGLLHDDYQLAAVNLSYPLLMITIAVSGIVGNGGASYIARCIGAGKKDEAEHTLTIGFELIIIGGLALTALGLVFADPLVRLLGAEDSTFAYTKSYCVVMLVGSIATMGNYAVGQLLRSEGSTFYSMVGMIAGTIANIILDPIFIFTLKLEIAGAAIATVLGNLLGLAIFIGYYARKKTLLSPHLGMLQMDSRIIGEIMWVGIPHTLEQFFSTAAYVVNNNLAAAYGAQSVAAMGIANKIMSFGTYIYQGMAAGCQPLMGYNYGAKNIRRLRQLILTGAAETTVIEVVIMGIYGILAPALIGLFSQTEEVVSVGTVTLRAFMLMLPFVGTTSIVRNTFNAIGKPFYSFGITIVRQLVLYIPFLLLFNHIWGYAGLIHAQPAEECICMVLSMILLLWYLGRDKTVDYPVLPGLTDDGRVYRNPRMGTIEAALPTGGFASAHGPALLETADGDLLCCWFAGSYEGNADCHIVLSRLNKGAYSWSSPIDVSRDPRRSEQNPSLFAAPDGSIRCMYTSQETRRPDKDNMQYTSVVKSQESRNGGRTWSDAEIIFPREGTFCRQPVQVLSSGRWIFGNWLCTDSPDGLAGDPSVFQLSDDEGRTWRQVDVPYSRGRVHPNVVELDDKGHLVSFMRSRGADRIYRSESTDFGSSWSVPVPTPLPNNNSGISALRLASGRIAIAYNPTCAADPGSQSGKAVWPGLRCPVAVALSEDGGLTFPLIRYMEQGEGFAGQENRTNNLAYEYPYLMQSRDGKLHLAFAYRSRWGIKWMSFSEQDIMGTKRERVGVYNPTASVLQ